MSKITYKEAREMSIMAWTMKVDGRSNYEITRAIHEKYKIYPINRCGFCEWFNENCYSGCPLFWPKAKEEKNSDYSNQDSLKCSRNFWKYMFWEHDERWRYHWAQKMLDEIKATPETEPEN